MAVLVGDCPECKTKRISMRMTGFSVPQHDATRRDNFPFGYVVGICGQCEKPSIYVLKSLGRATWDGVQNYLGSAIQAASTNNLSGSPYEMVPFESARNNSSAPGHLPDDVLKAFMQGETNFDMPGHEEASATMYRRALERALKFTHPSLTGTLAVKIKSLVESGALPTAVGDWATEIRIIGNDGAHDDEVTRDDLKAARMFCDSFLRYLVTLPKEIELRRSNPV